MDPQRLRAAQARIDALAAQGCTTAGALAEVLAIAQQALDRATTLQPDAPTTASRSLQLRAGSDEGINPQLGLLLDEVAAAMKAYVAPLLARIGELERAKTMRFCGPHDPSATYSAGDVCQRSGATWVCLAATAAAPGASSDWRRISATHREAIAE